MKLIEKRRNVQDMMYPLTFMISWKKTTVGWWRRVFAALGRFAIAI
jgi:hypothetical protein